MLQNEKLYDLYCSASITRVTKSRKNEMGGACSTYGDRRGVYRVLLGKPERNRPLGTHKSRWEDNIKMDL